MAAPRGNGFWEWTAERGDQAFPGERYGLKSRIKHSDVPPVWDEGERAV